MKTREKMPKFFCCLNRQDNSEEGEWRGRLRRRMVIVGDGECGKTSLVTRMAVGSFVDVGYVPTVFDTKVVDVSTGQEDLELVICDTAGQEDFDRLRPFSYNDVDVVLICFSLVEPSSLINVSEIWSPEIRYYCGDVPVILVGNKKDLREPPGSEGLGIHASISTSTSKSPLCPFGSEADEFSALEHNLQCSAQNVDVNCEEAEGNNVDTVAASAMRSPLHTPSFHPRFSVQTSVKHKEGALIARRIRARAYFETSALTGECMEELMQATIKTAVLGYKKAKKFKRLSTTLRS